MKWNNEIEIFNCVTEKTNKKILYIIENIVSNKLWSIFIFFFAFECVKTDK